MKYTPKLLLGFLTVLFGSLMLLASSPQKVLAATGSWVDVAHIQVGDLVFTDINTWDDNLDYKAPTSDLYCGNPVVRGFNTGSVSDSSQLSQATVVRVSKASIGDCQAYESADELNRLLFESQHTEVLTLSNVPNAGIYFHWVDAAQIESAFIHNGGLFTRSDTDPNLYVMQTESECKSELRVLSDTGVTYTPIFPGLEDGCIEGESSNYNVGSTSFRSRTAFTGTPRYYSSDDPTNDAGGESCETLGGVMGWVMCPVINLMDGTLNWLDTKIQGLLLIEESKYDSPELFRSWSVIRNLAYVILVPIMLIMVLGTALGFEVFSAYTVKKALPRMLIATIFITFSWYVCIFLIELFNAIGTGVLGIFTAPFGERFSGNMNLSTLFSVSSTGEAVAGAAFQWVGASALLYALAVLITAPGGLAIIGSYLFVASLFVFGAFLVLVMRQMFIIALILVAPLAILAWIFPGNDKLWKSWWGIFSKLLIMFPLIMAIIAAGRIFAFVIDSSGGGGDALGPLLKLTAYIIPYFFIPFTFKFAGGLFANLAGFVNDREKGLLDRSRKKRSEGLARMRERGSSTGLYGADKAANAKGFRGAWMRRANKVGQWALDPVSMTKITLGTDGGRATLSQIGLSSLDHSQKLAEQMKGINDRAAKAIALGVRDENGELIEYDGTVASLDKLAEALDKGDRMDRFGAKWLRDNGAILTTAHLSEDYGRADVGAAAALAYASQGFITPDEITEFSKGIAHRKDAPFLATPLNTMLQVAAARGSGTRPGYSSIVGEDGEFVTGGLDVAMELAAKVDVQTLGTMKGSNIDKNLAEAYEAILTSKVEQRVNRKGVLTDHLVYETVDERGNNVQQAVELDGNTIENTRSVLLQTYASYNAPDTRNRVQGILERSIRTKLTREGAAAGKDNDVIEAEIAQQIANLHAQLSRRSASTEDEFGRTNAEGDGGPKPPGA